MSVCCRVYLSGILLSILSIIHFCESSNNEETEFICTDWRLEKIQYSQDSVIVPPVNKSYTLHLLQSDSIVGQMDCNDLWGAYQLIDNRQIQFTKVGGTEVLCPGGYIGQEYMNALSSAHSYRLEDNRLYFKFNKDGQLIFLEQSSSTTQEIFN